MIVVVELMDQPSVDGTPMRDVITNPIAAREFISQVNLKNRSLGKGAAQPGDIYRNCRIVKISEKKRA